ncbi:MAG: CHAP domain-containing protein [Candidatus Microsaccharimonas sp.]|jgi:surface antigen/peptidoglycan hydrolase CwlO-like protein
MKLRATTPVSLSRFVKWGIALAIVVGITVAALYIARPTSADPYDDKIAVLQADMARYQAEANRLNAEAATLSNALAQITNEKNALQAQIDLNQTQYDKLVIEITETEKAIKDNQDGLGTTIADLYVDGNVSPIEMLASSDNITDFLNKQEYRNSVRDQLSSTIKTVKQLKLELDEKKVAVEKVLNEQKSARDSLAAKESEQAGLLSRTRNDESTYQGLIASSAQQIAEAKATQAAINARYNNNGGYTLVAAGSLAAYPWNSTNCPMWGYLSTGGADGNGGDGRGYGCRQCASYAAWKIAKVTGRYYSWGNAVNFTQNAKNAGYVEGAPRAGSIAVMDPAKAGQGYGHVAWVEGAANGMVTVSQYNYDYGQGYGMYSEMTLSENAFDHYIYIGQ